MAATVSRRLEPALLLAPGAIALTAAFLLPILTVLAYAFFKDGALSWSAFDVSVWRRMVDDELVASLAPLLRPGADVFMQTDVWDLALAGLEAFEGRDDCYVNRVAPWSFWREGNPFGVRSWREQNAEETGLPIWRMRYTRR